MKRRPRKRIDSEYSYLHIPHGHKCGICKSFKDCYKKGIALASDEVCELIPNNFALPGEESMAEASNRKDKEAICQP